MLNLLRKSKAVTSAGVDTSKADGLHKYKSFMDSMSIPAMLCDKDTAVVTYANKASIETLRTLEHLLPIKAEQIVGSCIDIFHKTPIIQRNILANERNLPHSAVIALGDEKLDLNINALHDANGNYAMASLTWSIVTARENFAVDSERLFEMVDKMPINVMMCDPETLEITFMNEASKATLLGLQQFLPVQVDDMVGTCIDIFHKNPENQRRILRDPANLPWRAKINVGPETLQLNISAIVGADGTYFGALATWEIITDQMRIQTAVTDTVESILGQSSTLKSQSSVMSAAADQNIATATSVAAAAEEATVNVQTVAAATEELGMSVTEISNQINRAADISGKASARTQEAEKQVKELAEASLRIGEVVKLINDIADQTNLLALNATIEAARAGDAGRGFAVVASEVKSLANQTAKATEDITVQIAAIQSETKNVVTAIDEIGTVIGEVNDIAGAIAASSEQQNEATNEIARNAQEAATGTQQVSTHIIEVQQATSSMASGIQDVLSAAQELETLSTDLRTVVEEANKD